MNKNKVYIKRTNYVINKTFQFRLIGTFLISILLALVIFTIGVVGYYWYSTMVGDNLFAEFITIHKQVERTEQVEQDGETVTKTYTETEEIPGVKRWEIVLPPILVNNLLILIVVGIIGLFYSHRLAGPVYRINADLQKVLNGERGVRISLRKDDKFHDLAEQINALIDSYEEAMQKSER